MKVMAVEPYFGGSHQAFLESLARHSRHDWVTVGSRSLHWKWRMRLSPLESAAKVIEAVDSLDRPDLFFCSGMLDVPGWLGVLSRHAPAVDWSRIPLVTYFHESQWTYPTSPQARVDHHYGYTNLQTALVSNQNWFNSQHHLESFLRGSRDFIRRMPDGQEYHPFDELESKCVVLPPGFDPPDVLPARSRVCADVVKIGWVSRWEHDKRPDRFLQLLRCLRKRGFDFELILLGPRSSSVELATIRHEFAGQIRFDQYAVDRDDYWKQLSEIDIVVSTADHEFFGIAICEAIHAGAVPILPNRLSYPELVDDEFRYNNLEEAVEAIVGFGNEARRRAVKERCQNRIRHLAGEHATRAMDEMIDRVVSDSQNSFA